MEVVKEMKRDEVYSFMIENQLYDGDLEPFSGIYAILINNKIAYIGKSVNCVQRATEHIYKMMNALYSNEKKYQLLLSAFIGGLTIKIKPFVRCREADLIEQERYYINLYKPPLNTIIPTQHKQNLSDLTIADLLSYLNADEL